MDGRLCPCTGSGMGLGHGEEVPGCGAGGQQQGGGRSLIALCSHTALHTHMLGVGCRRGRVSPGPPVLAWAASHHQGGQDEALLLLPLQRSGMEGTELQTRCCHRTPRGARLKTGGTTGQQQQQHQGCPPPTPPRQPEPSPRAASSKPCPCGMEVPGPPAGADSGHGAGGGAVGSPQCDPRRIPGVPRHQGTAQQSRPFSFSPRQPRRGSWPRTARGRRGDAHMLSASW